jgi:hypothetical protein
MFNESFRSTRVPFEPNLQNLRPSYTASSTEEKPSIPLKKDGGSGRPIVGLCLISIGAYFMLAEFNIIPDWFSIIKLWPLMIIFAGLAMMFRSGKKKHFERPQVNWGQAPANQDSSSAANQPLS